MKLALTAAFLFLSSFAAQAKVIELPYLKFNLPDTWVCTTDKTETICKSPQGSENKQAVVLINAKETTPAETIESFHQQLSKPKGIGTVKNIQYIKIGDEKWIQAHHSDSELPNYDTIYWITRVQNIAVLVSYSFLSKYSNTLYPLAQNLPRTFKLNLPEIARLSQITNVVQAQAPENQPTAVTDRPKESTIATPEQPKSLSQKVSNLLKSPYAIPIIVLCVIIGAFALFLR